MATTSILVVDDFEPWRISVRSILERDPSLQVIGEASDGQQAIERASEMQPDLILLDIGMPVLNGLDAADQIRRISPRSKIVFVTQEIDGEIRSKALASGADGFVLKINAHSDLLTIIKAAFSNHQAQ